MVITVALPLSQAQQEQLRAAAPGADFNFCDIQHVTPKDVVNAEILMGKIPPELCCIPKRLQWLQSHAAGPDSYRKAGVLADGVILTGATGAYGLAVAEHMLAMTLTLIKRLHSYRDAQRSHSWQSLGQVSSLWHANVLVLGLGDIGSAYAQYCHALGAQVIGVRRTVGETPPYLAQMCTVDKLDALLPWADIVAVCLPQSPETTKLLAAPQFALMKEGAVLVNGGRGSVVDTQALLGALRSGKLKGAGLDVTDPEPLPADHPLWDEPNAVITPHISGMFHLPETVQRLTDLFCDNLGRYLSNRPLRNVVKR